MDSVMKTTNRIILSILCVIIGQKPGLLCFEK